MTRPKMKKTIPVISVARKPVNLGLLKLKRLAAGVSQQEMANALHLASQNTWSLRERGKLRIAVDEIPIIAAECGMTLDDVNEIFFGNSIRKG